MEQWTLGARFYTNGPGEQIVRGPIRADFAEVVLYDRVLSNEERQQARRYFDKRYSTLRETFATQSVSQRPGIELVKEKDPPTVQMLVPGFEVDELPVELTNINSLRYRPDGKLVTLGYNGDIHLLSDSDGDGLEDHAQLFWKNEGSLRGPIGMVMTRPGDPQGWGVITPSKGKVSLIIDRDGDDRADEEVVIASGWKEITQNVDAVGMAMDRDGALYFGLGTADYSNAYLVDSSGKSHYDPHSDRGTVQKVSPDFKTRETICTGIRFPIAFAFNKQGDLFCTEQEGATWLANGNPFDELLHIQPNRHYGFPPRHPTYNPDVIDEPSTFDYGPQHQSTCGMVFNESIFGGPLFGPSAWKDDAIVCGESRGKLWRTKLVKSAHGYVAASQLIACLQMLTVDACVSPRGDLLVACHSGPPDWGTGPTGIGKVFRIRAAEQEVARPILAWAESANEIRIALDRPIDPQSLQRVLDQVNVEYGPYVRAGDRFENLAPPYAVVQRQSMAARYSLPVAGVSVTNDLRTVLVQVGAMASRANYAVTIPSAGEVPSKPNSIEQVRRATQLPQVKQWDVDVTHQGVQASWTQVDATDDSKPIVWEGWLPHLDLKVSEALTQGSAQHDQLWSIATRPGKWSLKTHVDLQDLLRPQVQPGSKLDFQLPPEKATLVLHGSVPFTVSANGKVWKGEARKSAKEGNSHYEATITLDSDLKQLVPVEVQWISKGQTKPRFSVAFSTEEDDRWRPLPLRRLFVPWVPNEESTASETLTKIAEIEGGNWGLGRRVFHSEAAACFKCHAIHGSGPKIGPDLSNLIHRDYASVRRDIIHPSFAINPDHLGQVVVLDNGQVLTGVLRTENGKLLLGDAEGKVTEIDRREIETIKPSSVSVMPQDLEKKLTGEQFRDLMTFLLTPPPHMPLESPLQAPPLRTPIEVANVLKGAPDSIDHSRALNIVLVAGVKDHGPGEHDYPAWQVAWGQLLASAPNVEVSAAWEFPSEEQLHSADILVFFQKGKWDDTRAKAMDSYFARGGGAVYIHWAVNGDERVADFSKRIGLASQGGNIRYRHGPLTLNVHSTDHEIMRNIDTMQLYDESYWLLTGDVRNVTLFATSLEDNQATPQVWAYEQGKGRVFVSIPGHYSWTFDDPIFRILLLRGTAWTARESVDRFNELVPLGARMTK